MARGQRCPFLSGLSWPICSPSPGFICRSDLIKTIPRIPLSSETGGPDLKGGNWVYGKWQRLAEARLGKLPPAPQPRSLSASLGDTDLEPISSNEQMGRLRPGQERGPPVLCRVMQSLRGPSCGRGSPGLLLLLSSICEMGGHRRFLPRGGSGGHRASRREGLTPSWCPGHGFAFCVLRSRSGTPLRLAHSVGWHPGPWHCR